MTPEQELLVLQEQQRHLQALNDIAAGKHTKNPENSIEEEENEFIRQMQEMNAPKKINNQ